MRKLRDLNLTAAESQGILSDLVPLIDIVVAAIGGPLVRMAWSFIRPFLLSAKAQQALHAEMVSRGMSS